MEGNVQLVIFLIWQMQIESVVSYLELFVGISEGSMVGNKDLWVAKVAVVLSVFAEGEDVGALGLF